MKKREYFLIHHLLDFTVISLILFYLLTASDTLKSVIFWLCSVSLAVMFLSSFFIYAGVKKAPHALTSPMKERVASRRYGNTFIDIAVSLLIALAISPILGFAWYANTLIAQRITAIYNLAYHQHQQSLKSGNNDAT